MAFLTSVALAQQHVNVIGPITPGDCPQFSSTTVLKDGGFPCNGAPGTAITALTGDVTATGPGSVPATIAANAVTNAKLAQMAANSEKCNPTNAIANVLDCVINALHSKDFGATGNGSTDDTTNLQTWITACQTRVIPCYLDAGTYKTSLSLSITGYIQLTGAGRNSAIIAPSNATQNTFTISTTAPAGQIQNISNAPSVTKTAGAFINLTSPSTNNQFWTFRDLSTSGNDFDGFVLGAASNFILDNVLESCLHRCVDTGVTGDSVIINSIFQPAANNAVAVSIGTNGSSSANGSGLRVVNNKINSGFTGVIGIQLFGAAACASCSDLIISDNSIEVLGNAVLLGPANSATSFTNITITGNELNGNAGINNTDSTAWLGTITITGNSIIPIGGPGINIQNAKNFTIDGNVFTGVSGANFGINLSALVSGCAIGVNQFSGFSVANIADASGTCLGLTNLPGYAQGTWTPTLFGTTVAGTPTYTTQVGSYTKIGRQINLQFTLQTSALGGPTGNMQIGGLPFAAGSGANDNGSCSFNEMTGVTLSASHVVLTGDVTTSSTFARLKETGSGVSTALAAVGEFAATTVLIGTCTYHN